MVTPRLRVSLKFRDAIRVGDRSCLGKENGKQNLVASPVQKALLLLKGASCKGEKGAPG